MSTRAANKAAAAKTAKADENIEVIEPAQSVGRSVFDPSALVIGEVEAVEKPVSSRAIRFGEDHPLYLAYKDSYEKEQARKVTTPHPDEVEKGLRKLAVQLDLGVSILSKDADSITFLAKEKRVRRTPEQLAAAETGESESTEE